MYSPTFKIFTVKWVTNKIGTFLLAAQKDQIGISLQSSPLLSFHFNLISINIPFTIKIVHFGNSNIEKELALSYSREKPGSHKCIELLSCVAQQYSNKELQKMFSYSNSPGEGVLCTKYELTKARLHSKMYGPGAWVFKVSCRFCQKLLSETISLLECCIDLQIELLVTSDR